MHRLFFLVFLFTATSVFAAEDLLIMDVFARVLPAGQAEGIPDPFLEGLISGNLTPLPAGVEQIQGRTFQIRSASSDFEAVIPGAHGQRIEASFTAVVLRNGNCAVTNFQLGAVSESSTGNVRPSNASQTMSRGGFSIAPGQRIAQSVSVKSKDGTIFYYLIFSAAKGIID